MTLVAGTRQVLPRGRDAEPRWDWSSTSARIPLRWSGGSVYTAAVKSGVHHLKLVDVRGLVALEGLAIASRTG